MTGGFGKIINGQKNTFNPKNKKRDPITNGWDWLSVPLDEGDYFASEFFEKRPNGSHWISLVALGSWGSEISSRRVDGGR
jgi:hypothetical protein